MKNKIIICGVIVAMGVQCRAYGAVAIGGGSTITPDTPIQRLSCDKVTCPTSGGLETYEDVSKDLGFCTSNTDGGCYKDSDSGKIYHVKNCTSCQSGYELTIIASKTKCGLNYINYTSCQEICNTSTNCESDTSWSSAGTGYQQKANRSCNTSSNQCFISSTQYRCAPGYYGSSTNGTSGCSQCPEWSGVYTNSARTTLARGTSSAGATAITGCYIASGTYYDATGTFTISGNCPYK